MFWIGSARRFMCVGGMHLLLLILAIGCSDGPSRTRRAPVDDTYHGVTVSDDYRWLENWDDSEVQAWSEAQNRHARRVLDRLPSVRELRERITEIEMSASVSYASVAWSAGRLLAMKQQPPKQQPFLVVMPSADAPDDARVLVDPNDMDSEGGASIDWYVPSPDGRHVAVSISRGGSEIGDLHVFEIETGLQVGEVVPRVNGGTAGGDVAWTRDGSGFYYTRYPRPGERPQEDLGFHQQIWFHELGGSGETDRHELGRDFPRIAEFRLQTDPSSGRVLATYQYGDSGRFQLHVRELDGSWIQLTDEEDQIVQAEFAPDGSLFAISRNAAPKGKIVRLLPGARSIAGARTIVEEGQDTIVSDFWGAPPMLATATRLYVTIQLGGPSTIRVFDHTGRAQSGPEVLPVSRIRRIAALEGDDVLFRNESYLLPDSWYRFGVSGETRKTALASIPSVDFADSEVLREFATSKDGTRVPVNIIRRKGIALDGSNPVLLYGYGGYGISVAPRYRASSRVWIEQGGVYAVANIRGGGEFGEGWHRAGMLTEKQNVFDDFAAAMNHMIDRGYTTADKLAIMGGSNGGLLMGAMITRHPERCRAVASLVGVYDMLRAELSPNGVFNIPEFGTVKDPEQFRAMYAYSPYHRVEDGRSYPAVLFTTGANDPRVDPMHSRKMTAHLQAANAPGRPVLLRTSASTGHGSGTPLSEHIEEQTHIYAFLFHELGVAYRSGGS